MSRYINGNKINIYYVIGDLICIAAFTLIIFISTTPVLIVFSNDNAVNFQQIHEKFSIKCLSPTEKQTK